MAYLEELLPDFRKGAKIRCKGWGNDTYIEMNESTGIIINNKGKRYIFSYEDFAHYSWEFYQEPEPDWNYIIKNKCLCWFWDVTDDMKIGVLGYVYSDCSEPFHPINSLEDYEHCRPVRRDEVTFYEDRKYE